MTTRSSYWLFPALSAVFVAALFLFLALWLNGNFSVPIAVAIGLVLGVGTYLSMVKRPAHDS